MRCAECHAELSPNREFCPQCGTPTRLRRRGERPAERPSDRSTERLSERLAERMSGRSARLPDDDRPEAEVKRSRRRVFVLGAALLFGVAVLGKVNFVNADIDLGRDAPRSGPAVVTAQQLYQEYFADAEAADDKYRNREMVVTGEFLRIVPDGNGNPDLRLATSNPDAPWGADLIGVAHEPATRLRPGQQVTVSCQRLNLGGQERWLQNCAIQNVAEGEAAAGEAAAAAREAAAEARTEARAAAREAGAVAREAAAAAREAAREAAAAVREGEPAPKE